MNRPDRATVRAAVAELKDRGDRHEAERFQRLSLAAELKLIADAERSEAARRARRKAAREAQDRARAELKRELEAPLIGRRVP